MNVRHIPVASMDEVILSPASARGKEAARPWRQAHRLLRNEILVNQQMLSSLRESAAKSACFIPNPGNLGDSLIQLGTYNLFECIGWSPEIRPGIRPENLRDCQFVVLGGGGAWVEGLLEEQARCLRPYLEAGGGLVLLPSSISGFDEYFRRYASQVILFVREKRSYERLNALPELQERVHLCHDLAFATDPETFEIFDDAVRSGTLHLFRRDGESRNFHVPDDNVDLAHLWNGGLWENKAACLGPLIAAARLLAQFERVKTDRLHMTALAAMNGCQVEMYSNNYFKNEGVYDFSLHKFQNVSFRGTQTLDLARDQANDERDLDKIGGEERGIDARGEELIRHARLRREYFEPEIARLNAAVAEYERTKREWFEPELQRLTKVVEEASASLARSKEEGDEARRRIEVHFEPDIARLNAAVAEYERTKRERYEPELARLNTLLAQRELAQKELLREVQDERARVLYYIDQVAMLARQIDPLRARTEELERLKRDWFDPEFQRMHKAIEEYEKAKREWFEPQLRQHQTRLAELEFRLSSMARFEGSRSYRVWYRLQTLYRVPVIGPMLRVARGVVGALLRRRGWGRNES